MNLHLFLCLLLLCKSTYVHYAGKTGKNRVPQCSAVISALSYTTNQKTKVQPSSACCFYIVFYLISSLGGAGVDSPTSKKGTFFLMPLALSVPIINKIYNRTKAGEGLKLKPVSKLCEPALRITMTSPRSVVSVKRF